MNIHTAWKEFENLLGVGRPAQELDFTAIVLRAVLMFFAVLILLRFANKRFLAQRNALDTLLGFLLASMLARAINGSERFFETIAAGFVLVLLHRGLSWAAFRSHGFGKWLKGNPETVIKNGKLLQETLSRLHLSRHDVEEDLRLKTGDDALDLIEQGQIERNGEMSVKRR
jgi:uncharacterized membrane protein YcaP (DUF421 family)